MTTAVEFLYAALSFYYTQEQEMQFEGLFQQALEMEKQQIMDAYMNGGHDALSIEEKWDRYYNETYKKD